LSTLAVEFAAARLAVPYKEKLDAAREERIWSGINAAKVLVAELTTKNPNVFYELGLAHALDKPVVLVSSNEQDVPFDLRHIRVIYYDVTDPFWGQKLIEKVAENILSALKNPEEAVFNRALDTK
jgi:hypothetical protein